MRNGRSFWVELRINIETRFVSESIVQIVNSAMFALCLWKNNQKLRLNRANSVS